MQRLLFQIILSFVRRLKLGGKEKCHLAASHPLSDMSKELSDFVALMEKIQSQIEDEKIVARAIDRVLKTIRGHVLATWSGLKRDAVEGGFERVKLEVKHAIEFNQVEETATCSPARTISSGGSVVGRETMKVCNQTYALKQVLLTRTILLSLPCSRG